MWKLQSVAAMLLLVPAWLSLSLFERIYGVRGDVTAVWYFLGVVVTGFAYHLANGAGVETLYPSTGIVLMMLLVGVVFGSAANMLAFRATSIAPNAGVPVAIVNMSAVFVFLGALALAKYWPQYFAQNSFDLRQFAGLVLTVAGGFLMLKR